MDGTIRAELAAIAESEGVRLLYAVESGSRAWGFASTDSDWDARFLYVRPRDWYLSVDLEHRRDVIERPVSDALDINGWDLRKALKLLRKSNPPLLEWLHSPVVYLAEAEVVERLREQAEVYYSPVAGWYHYLHMAEGNYREYLRGETVRVKKYLYVLRPLLAARWLERHGTPAPVEFARLVADDPEPADGPVKAAVAELLARKIAGEELDRGPSSPVLNAFIESELERLREARPTPPRVPGNEPLNELFRWVLRWAWE
ncbi:MAG: nucleotidyltransferase domain-containing protein [Armatimonadetes bacterium]|nr:nucleotidyltransferase domain-containing protein [Armatimonadota bacterium]